MLQSQKFEFEFQPLHLALQQVNLPELSKELKVENKDLIDYLQQLIKNIQKEIALGIYVIPFNFGQNLTIFIEHYNRIILKYWLKGYGKRFCSTQDLGGLVGLALKDFNEFEQLVEHFSHDKKLIKYKVVLMQLITHQIVDYFTENQIQVTNNLFLIPIGTIPELRNFLILLNQELSYNALKEEISNTIIPRSKEDIYVDIQDQQNEMNIQKQQASIQNQNKLKQQVAKFINGLNLREPPDNRKKKLVYQGKSRQQYHKKRTDFIGIFDDFNHFFTFKLLRNLTTELFEIGYLKDYLNQKKQVIQNFDIETFVKLFKFPCEINNQLTLNEILIKQLENTKINMREAKEFFYKSIFVSFHNLIKNKNYDLWSKDYYIQNLFWREPLPTKQKNQPNYEYFEKVNPCRVIWREGAIKQIVRLKNLNFQKNNQNKCKFQLAIYQILGLLIQIESDYVFGLYQTYEQQKNN